jgi:hypothetical protein
LSRRFGDPNNQENSKKYADIIHHLVQFVCSLHKHDWLSRDICCRNLYYDSQRQKVTCCFYFSFDYPSRRDGIDNDENPLTSQVFSPRLGRMVYIYPDQILDDSVIDEVFPDRRNW